MAACIGCGKAARGTGDQGCVGRLLVEVVKDRSTVDQHLAVVQHEGGHAREWVVGADVASQGSIPGVVPLVYQEPGPDERAVLRELYQEHGSKNKALAVAYSLGKTPKSLGWLNEALAEMGTR